MGKKISTFADANGLLLPEIRKQEKALGKSHGPSGKDEAVIATASQRDRMKFIPRRMN
jgi:hypothetical protein